MLARRADEAGWDLTHVEEEGLLHVYPILPIIPEARRAFRQNARLPPMTGVRALSFAELDPVTAYAVWRLRQRVFVVEQRAPYPDLDGRDLEPTTRHLLVEESGELVAYLRLLDDGVEARIGRVVVAPEARGRGYADELMRVAMLETGDRPVVLDAQTGLAGWYATFGFEVTGPEFDDDGVLHLPMRREGTPA